MFGNVQVPRKFESKKLSDRRIFSWAPLLMVWSPVAVPASVQVRLLLKATTWLSTGLKLVVEPRSNPLDTLRRGMVL